MRYTISKSLEVRIWLDEGEAPNILQPTWADGTAWASKAEAKAWAEQYILSFTDETADLPGVSPAEPTVPRGKKNLLQELEIMGYSLEEIQAALKTQA